MGKSVLVKADGVTAVDGGGRKRPPGLLAAGLITGSLVKTRLNKGGKEKMIRKHLIASLIVGALSWTTAPALAQGNAPAIAAMTAEDIVKALKSEGRVAMSGTFFESNSANLTAESASVLAKLAESLAQLPDAKVAVVGHSDSTGDFAYNVDLSARRAQNVIEALVKNQSVRRARLVALGAGPIDPAASNSTEEGRAQNRRVAFVVIDEAEAGSADESIVLGFWLNDPVTDCAIWSAEQPAPGEKASWTGSCANGKASGKGNLLFWDEQGILARYDGEMQAGKVHGVGAMKFRSEDGTGLDSYVGKFENGAPVGEGVLVGHNGYRFEGELIDGINHGRGKLTTPEGWEVRGEIKDGKTVGEALAYYKDANGDLYFGDIENSKRHGFGVLLMANDDAYNGEFVDGAPSGSGMFEAANGSQYLGIFANGSPNGMGTVIDVEGTSYQGRFVNGGAEGQILVTTTDGTQTIETWKDGEKVQ
jgi:outer membrane protein OmpA-like peptidoglycan-associated protein